VVRGSHPRPIPRTSRGDQALSATGRSGAAGVVTTTGSDRFEVAEERHALETQLQLQVEGLVVCSGLLPASDVATFAARIPTVVAGRPETRADVTSVFCDEDEGGAALADHVVELGHRAVAVIRLGPEQSLTMAPRTAAMTRRLRERGVLVVEVAGGLVDETRELVGEIRAHEEVTAVMAPSGPSSSTSTLVFELYQSAFGEGLPDYGPPRRSPSPRWCSCSPSPRASAVSRGARLEARFRRRRVPGRRRPARAGRRGGRVPGLRHGGHRRRPRQRPLAAVPLGRQYLCAWP